MEKKNSVFVIIILLSLSTLPLLKAQQEPEPLFTIHYIYPTGAKINHDIGILLKQEWAKIGINLELEALESSAVNQRIWALEGWPTYPTFIEGGFDVHLMEYGFIPTDLIYYMGCYSSEGIPYLGWNYWCAHDGRADLFLRDAMSTYDHEDRLTNIYKWQDQKQEEVNEIQLAYPQYSYLMTSELDTLGFPWNYHIDRWLWSGKNQIDDVTVRYGIGSGPNKWLSLFINGGASFINPMNRQLFKTIHNPETNEYHIEPDLATNWEFSDDNMILTITLRDDVVFHDGHPFTSEDVKWTFDAILDPTTGASFYTDFSSAVESVNIIDDYNININLKKASPEIMTLLGVFHGYMGILPAHVLKDIPHDQLRTCDYNTRTPPPGLGPMKFLEWKEGQYVTYEAWDDYYDGRILIDKLIMMILPDADTALAALEKHEVDILHPRYTESYLTNFPQLREKTDLNTDFYSTIGIWFISLNNDHPILCNKWVRKALAYATPYDKIIDDIFMSSVIKANSPIHPDMWAWNPDTIYYTYDLTLARECLLKAGYPDWPPQVQTTDDTSSNQYMNLSIGAIIGATIGIVAMYLVTKKR